MSAMRARNTNGNWIKEGRAALDRYRECDPIDQPDTLAVFVEQALVKTGWDGKPPLTGMTPGISPILGAGPESTPETRCAQPNTARAGRLRPR